MTDFVVSGLHRTERDRAGVKASYFPSSSSLLPLQSICDVPGTEPSFVLQHSMWSSQPLHGMYDHITPILQIGERRLRKVKSTMQAPPLCVSEPKYRMRQSTSRAPAPNCWASCLKEEAEGTRWLDILIYC